ncbi:hypothetical protein TNIN_245531 [Trichonephila inaurata madagascariensis]|uniref:C2H2-type domain-containing protein n=1 Tax=Trichonephila inaurata madagascariensis TaxID=2747483 RepID=A0A8X7CUS5_9ARAC|nr:hypothetical protein TNIN_245531 [Trichonephila inaurata madagascariensis]
MKVSFSTTWIDYFGKPMKLHKCGECSYSTIVLNDVKRHFLTHTGEKPYKYSLRLKIATSHPVKSGKIHKCGVCSYSSKYVSAVERHLLTHTGERPYECIVCGQSFRTKFALKRHSIGHFNIPNSSQNG